MTARRSAHCVRALPSDTYSDAKIREDATMQTETNHAVQNAVAHLESIRELMTQWHTSADASNQADTGAPDPTDAIEERIFEYPLSVQVRSRWFTPGVAHDPAPAEYKILLTTGGPALRIVGELDDYAEPTNAKMQWQDWGTPWTDLHMNDVPDSLGAPSEIDKLLLSFAARFYYGAS